MASEGSFRGRGYTRNFEVAFQGVSVGSGKLSGSFWDICGDVGWWFSGDSLGIYSSFRGASWNFKVFQGTS